MREGDVGGLEHGESDASAFPKTDRFALRRFLGQGGMGVVYEAWDREREAPVALKTLRASEPHLITRLKREFRALADVQHPNLARLGELFFLDGRWFFTMELLEEARDVLSYVRVTRTRMDHDVSPSADTLDAHDRLASKLTTPHVARIDEARLRECLKQIALGLCALHDAGKVHRDLKPSNILVVPGGRTVVVDFGLVADLAGERSSEANIVGTPIYMAPEQAASQPPTAAADWYAVGVLLYEMLTGEFPHDGDPLALLIAKQTQDPEPPRVRNPDVPTDLDDLCMALLRRDPRDRPTGREVLATIGTATPNTSTRSSPSEPPFVGRRDCLAELDRAVDEVSNGATIVVPVIGESGIGKSALVRHFVQCQTAASRRAIVLTGRCYERETVPYKAFDGIVDSLVTQLEAMDPFESATLVPADAGLLGRVFPALRRVPAFARAMPPSLHVTTPNEQRTRAFKALREVLSRLGERAPLIVYMDDFHWADPDSLALFEELFRSPHPPRCLVLATMRSSDNTTALLARIKNTVESLRPIIMQPLAEQDAIDLTRRLLRVDGAATLARLDEIVKDCSGHPLFLQELVRELAGGASDDVPADQPVTVRLDEVVWKRIQRMEPTARRLVEIVAVAGAPIPQHVAARAAGLPRDEALGYISVLRMNNLVRTEGAKARDTVWPYHDRVREAVMARLDEQTCHSHHARLAEVLETDGFEISPQRLISHLLAAGQNARAAEVAQIAARRAEESLAFDQAAELYALALRLREHDAPQRLDLLLSLGGALAHAGRGPDAADAFSQAASLSTGQVRLDALQRAAEHLLGSGHLERGFAALDTVLADIGERAPRTSAGVLSSLAWHRFRVRMRNYRWKRRDESEISAADLTRLHIYGAVAVGLAHIDTLRAADYQSRGLIHALKLGEPKRVCKALAREAGFLAAEGASRSEDAFRLLEKARAIARDLREPSLDAFNLGVETLMSVCTGRFSRAPEFAIQAENVRRVSGGMTQWELNPIRMFHLRALRFLGLMTTLDSYVAEYLYDAQKRGDLYIHTGMAFAFNVTWLARDDVPGALQEIHRRDWSSPASAYHVQHLHRLIAESEISLYEGSAAQRLMELRERIDGFLRSLLNRIQIMRCETQWLRGRLAVAAAVEAADPAALLTEATDAAKRLSREKVEYASAWEMLLRAAIHARRREDDAALAAVRDAVRRADALSLNLVAAVARLREGELLGGTDGARLVRAAEERITSLGVKKPARMAEVLAPGFRRD
jgi:eukaryotic-like serine/threonine-protein kinase